MIGKTLAHYEITGLLGRGGMGEVYRARDTKLDREVALKLLPPDIAQDPERLARFRREAKVLASLNHTNIAAIYGLEESDGQLFLALELAEGDDLAQRLTQGPVSVEDTLSVARQLAEGLEQAHERGVVHRDLKPANVKWSADGTVKILDFGLARAYAGESAEEGDPASSPTITAAMTQAGTILGTAAYMSPEQARGQEVDRRADIWAFGVILFEMLTGKRLFQGETISDTLAEVLKTEADLEALPESVPVALRWLIERCLQKKPGKRLRDIGEARVLLESDLDELPASLSSGKSVVVIERPAWVVPAIVAIGLVAAVVGFFASGWMGSEVEPAHAVHAALLPPPDHSIFLENGSHIAMAPDGTRIAFVAIDSTGSRQLWVRRLDSSAAHLLSGTEGAGYPFWSPDGRKLGFFSGGRLRKIDATGGVSTAVCDAPNGRGGTWTEDDRILFAFAVRDHLQIVPASGGEPLSVTELDSVAWSHRWPVAMPGGQHFVYLEMKDSPALRWRSMDSAGDEKILLNDVHRAMYGDGHLFFTRDNALWARPFDPPTGEFLGEERLVAETVVTSSNFGSSAYGVARDGTLVYAAGAETQMSVLGVFDGEGTELERIDFRNSNAQDPNLSADGRYLAVALFPAEGSGRPDIWIRDLQRGTLSRLTTDAGADDPVWDPQGGRIVYSVSGTLVIQSTTGSREILHELEIGNDALPHDWSNDGRFIVYSVDASGRELWLLSVDDLDSRRRLTAAEDHSLHAAFSPDGNWIAYMSLRNGDPQIYLRSLGEDGGTWQVSPGLGAYPRWRADSGAIIYATMSATRVAGLAFTSVDLTGQRPELGAETKLFTVDILGGRSNSHRYDMTDDATRFTIFLDPDREPESSPPLELIVGWRQISGGQ